MKLNITKLYLQFWLLLVFTGAKSVVAKKKKYEISSSVNYTESVHTNCSTTDVSLACSSPWQYCEKGECICGHEPYPDKFQCKSGKTKSVLNGYCVTMMLDKNNVGYSTFIGECIYHKLFYQEEASFPIQLNELVCGRYFNRTGILCGACKEDHYPLVYSFDMNCIKCSNKFLNAFKFVIAAFLPVTVLYFIVVLFNINASNSYLTGFVLCCQGMVIPIIARRLLLQNREHKILQTTTRVLGSIQSIWNLDTFRFLKLNICLGTDSLQTLALDLVLGIYPFLLIILSYALIKLYDSNIKILVIGWKPFKKVLKQFRQNLEVKTSLIDAFSTFIFLSDMKFLNVSSDLLTPVSVYQLNSEGKFIHSWRLYYDATVPYFGKRHFPYAVLALGVLILFVITPILLQILYPFCWFQKLLNLFPFRWYVLHTFMDTFQGCYKDGTEPGTRDHRWFASSFFLLRFFGMIIGVLLPNHAYFPFAAMMLTIATILFIVIQPYKPNLANYSSINASFLLLLAVWYTSFVGYHQAWFKRNEISKIPFHAVDTLTATLTLSYISAVILKWVWRKFGAAAMKRFHAERQGYNALN